MSDSTVHVELWLVKFKSFFVIYCINGMLQKYASYGISSVGLQLYLAPLWRYGIELWR